MESELEYPERPLWWNGEGRDDVVAKIEYPTAVIIAPMACIMFLFLWLFEDELRPVDRYWVKKKYRSFRRRCREKGREGIYLFNRWKNQR
jgi:hypothetical protein